MRRIALFAVAGLVAVSLAGCAVEVPMSAFRLGPVAPLQAEQVPAPKPQAPQNAPAAR